MAILKVPTHLPAVIVNEVLIPGSTLRIADSSDKFTSLVKSKFLTQKLVQEQSIIAVIPNNNEGKFSYGTAASVIQVTGTNWPKPFYSLLVSGLCRIRISKYIKEKPYYVVACEQLESVSSTLKPQCEISESEDVVVACEKLKNLLQNLASSFGSEKSEAVRFRQSLNNLTPHLLADIACQYVSLTEREKLNLLSKVDILDRLRLLIPLVEKQTSMVRSVTSLKRLPASNQKSNHVIITKQGALDEILKSHARQKNSQEGDMDPDEKSEIDEVEAKIDGLPQNVKECATKELNRLKKMMPHMPDYTITRSYLDFLVELPWNYTTPDRLDLEKARLTLDSGHYGLEQIKKRLIEFLAVRKVLSDRGKTMKFNNGPILCFVGPPGVGKTSIARTLADVMGRKFQRISLGGVCDHADIRGHRRTYVGAMPGRIMAAVKTAGSKNPLILLDEVDKTSPGVHGDPAAALLEVLDSEQNSAFVDHYLNIPFDLSQVIFITTANSVSNLHAALLDRMEIINISSYTPEEKTKIVEGYLFPKQLDRHALSDYDIKLERDAISTILSHYTKEAGVRQLERVLETLCRRLCARLSKEHTLNNFVITASDLVGMLGSPRYKFDIEPSTRRNVPGICLGLAWTPMGGEVMHVEVSAMPGEGKLHLTGQLGDVIKESALLAFSWLRSRLGHNTKSVAMNPQSTNLHVHLPSGAVAKDGPSAGLALLAAMVSLFAQTPTRSTVACTGEISLRGFVLPVGGIREKLSAARRYGVKTVVLPKANEADVEADVPDEIKQSLRLIFVKRVEVGLLEILDQPSAVFSEALQLTNSHL